jgi:hypothetical protein
LQILHKQVKTSSKTLIKGKSETRTTLPMDEELTLTNNKKVYIMDIKTAST